MANQKKLPRKITRRTDGEPGKNIFTYKKTVRVNGRSYVIERAYQNGEWNWNLIHNGELYVQCSELKYLIPALYKDYINI